MSYRDECSCNETQIVAAATESELVLLNGTIPELTIPCSYTVVAEDGTETTTPIHLTAEGYADPVVAIEDAPTGLSGRAWIDDVDDSIVHVVFSAQCPDAVDEDIVRTVSVLITRTADDNTERTDVILHGTLTIQAGPYTAVPVDQGASTVAAQARSLYSSMFGDGVLADITGAVVGETLTLDGGSALLQGVFLDLDATPATIDMTSLSGTVRVLLRWSSATQAITAHAVPVTQALVRNANTYELEIATMTESGNWSQPVFAYEVAGTLTDPVGSYKGFAMNSIPKSYLPADGSAVSRKTYPRLYAKIGTAYGAGDGSTTFNLPDFQGKTAVGQDLNDLDFDGVTHTGGAKQVTLDATEIPSHDHTINHDHASATTASSGNHNHTVPAHGDARDFGSGSDAVFWFTGAADTYDTTSAGAHTHTVDLPNHTGSSGAAGGGQAHDNLPPYGVQVICIRA